MDSEALPERAQQLLDDLREPKPYVVRLYVLSAGDLPERSGDKPDPYLRASLGKRTQDLRKVGKHNTSEAEFHTMFSFTATLPGESVVRLEVVDQNTLHFDKVAMHLRD